MTKKIHTTFPTNENAEEAKEYLLSVGYEQNQIEMKGDAALSLSVSDNDWEGAFQIVNSLGGEPMADTSEEFSKQLNEYYQLENPEHVEQQKQQDQQRERPIPPLDEGAFFDPNIGIGDTELKEPYILHNYHALTEGKEDETVL